MEDEEIWRSLKAPKDLPTLDDIVTSCARAGFNRNGVPIRVAGNPRFWAKYSLSITRGEGLTQDHVAKIVNYDLVRVVRVPEVYLIFSRERVTYIIMELVEGTTLAQRKLETGRYGKDQIKAVAAAVQRLTQIRMPANTAPGHINGGCIGHDFFVESLSTLKYPTVGDLERHINRVLSLAGHKRSVNFENETSDGLNLCPSDLDDSNFMVDSTGAIWNIDFGCTCFLPSSFMYYSLKSSSKVFVQRIARLLKHPNSDNFLAMQAAAGLLVIFNDNSFGGPSTT